MYIDLLSVLVIFFFKETTMPFYVKKPVKVEAIQFTGEDSNLIHLEEWMHDVDLSTLHGVAVMALSERVRKDGGWKVKSLEGNVIASVGDYVIKGVKGEFYVCRQDIFEETYNKVG